MVELEIIAGRRNRARLNRSPVTRPREVLGVLRTVLFAPEDLALVKGDPDGRRRFLDDLLVARAPRFAGVRADYERVLRQRNALLKTAGLAPDAPGRAATSARSTSGTRTSPTAGAELLAGAAAAGAASSRRTSPGAYAAVSGGQGERGASAYRSSRRRDDVTAEERPTREPRGAGPAAGGDGAGSRRPRARARASAWSARTATTCVLTLGGLPAKGYASHGESWSFALALRLASTSCCAATAATRRRAGADPRRRVRRARHPPPGAAGRAGRAGAEQVLVTAAVAGDVPEALAGARMDVMAGAGDAVSD